MLHLQGDLSSSAILLRVMLVLLAGQRGFRGMRIQATLPLFRAHLAVMLANKDMIRQMQAARIHCAANCGNTEGFNDIL